MNTHSTASNTLKLGEINDETYVRATVVLFSLLLHITTLYLSIVFVLYTSSQIHGGEVAVCNVYTTFSFDIHEATLLGSRLD